MSDEIEKITVRHTTESGTTSSATLQDRTWLTHEYWPERGVIGSYRTWLGHRYTRQRPPHPPAAAITWLLDNS